MNTPAKERLRSDRRAIPSLINECSSSSTNPELTGIEIRSGPEIVVSIGICVPTQERQAAAREGFTQAGIRDLRKLVDQAERPEVRQAATAVLEFASGTSYAACAEGTPFGSGWVRALVQAFLDGGVEAIEQREYRRPRKQQ
jgi:hypothetical protein